jgi:hypothetical protein
MMIVVDLDHLESIQREKGDSNFLVEGQGIMVFAPLVDLRGNVRTSSNPSFLSMDFFGYVQAGGYAYLNVNQGGSIYARSPV